MATMLNIAAIRRAMRGLKTNPQVNAAATHCPMQYGQVTSSPIA